MQCGTTKDTMTPSRETLGFFQAPPAHTPAHRIFLATFAAADRSFHLASMDADFSLHADEKMRNDFLARTILENERLKSEIGQLHGGIALSLVSGTEPHALQKTNGDPLARTILENEQLKSEIARLKGGAAVPVKERPVAFTAEPQGPSGWLCCARRTKLTSRFQALPGETPVLTMLGNVPAMNSGEPPAPLGGVVSSSISPEAIEVAQSVYSEALRRYRGSVSTELQPFDDWEAVEVLIQVVAGTNFFIKVRIGQTEGLPKPGVSAISLALTSVQDEFLQLRIFQPLPHTCKQPELVSMLRGDDAAGPLLYF